MKALNILLFILFFGLVLLGVILINEYQNVGLELIATFSNSNTVIEKMSDTALYYTFSLVSIALIIYGITITIPNYIANKIAS